jgi:hypothetical protein
VAFPSPDLACATIFSEVLTEMYTSFTLHFEAEFSAGYPSNGSNRSHHSSFSALLSAPQCFLLYIASSDNITMFRLIASNSNVFSDMSTVLSCICCSLSCYPPEHVSRLDSDSFMPCLECSACISFGSKRDTPNITREIIDHTGIQGTRYV